MARSISGLGSSAVGRSYSWLDSGLTNGVRYFYRLEDVDTRSKVTSHGPVSAVPDAALTDPTQGQRDEPEGREDAKGGDKKAAKDACPAWVVSAYGQTAPSGSVAPLRCSRHGKPESVALEVLSQSSRGAELELRTDGFYAVHEADGSVRLFVPGFDTPEDPTAPALPLRRALVDAVVGRRVELLSAEARDLVAYRGLTPAAVGVAEIEVSRQGAIRGARRAIRPARQSRGYVPQEVARLLEPVFQGEAKSAVVELTPLRYDGAGGQLVLARRVRVRLSFAGRDLSETGRGHRGRKPKPEKAPALRGARGAPHHAARPPRRRVRAPLPRRNGARPARPPAAASPGRGGCVPRRALGHLVRARQRPLLPLRPRGGVRGLLERDRVGAGSRDGRPRRPGRRAPRRRARRPGRQGLASCSRPTGSTCRGSRTRPTCGCGTPACRVDSVTKTFALPGLDAASPRAAELTVYLQGGSESGQAVDHHLRLSLGGVPLGDVRFAGKRPFEATVPVPAGLLQEATNSLRDRERRRHRSVVGRVPGPDRSRLPAARVAALGAVRGFLVRVGHGRGRGRLRPGRDPRRDAGARPLR